MMLGQYRDALVDTKKCIELDPTVSKVYTLLFTTYKSLNTRLISINLQAYVRMAKCCLILGDLVEADSALKKLLELDPTNKAIAAEQRNLAYVQKHLNDADTAYNAKDFRKVINRYKQMSVIGNR